MQTEARRDVVTMIAVTLLSWTGQRLTAVALPLVALHETKSFWATGLVGGMTGLATVTAPWWGARLRTRLTTGRALALVLLLEVAGLVIVPLAATLGTVRVWHLVLSGLVVGLALALYGPGSRALLSDVADQISGKATVQALSVQDFAHRFPMVYAPPLAAWAVARGWSIPLLWAESLGVLVAAVLLATVRGHAAGPQQAEGAPRTPLRTGFWTLLRGVPDVSRSFVMQVVGGFMWMAFSLGPTLRGAELGRDGALVAATMAGYGATSLAMSFVAPFLVPRLPALPTIATAWTCFGLALLALPAAGDDLVALTLVAGAGGLLMPLGIGAHDGLISRSATGEERRTLFAIDAATYSGAYSLGMLVGGGIIGTFGSAPVLLACGAVQVVVPLAILLLRGRALRSRVREQ